MNTLLSFGHGYSARALTRILPNDDWTVVGTTRSEEKAQALKAEHVIPAIWPGQDMSPYIEAATHILISAGPTEDGDPVLSDWSDALAKSSAEWIGYLSTTGVYGDHQSGWVDETTALTPSTRRGQWRKEAEESWQGLAAKHDLPLHIFRLAGIYGPGRGPFAKVRNGTARRIIKKDQVFSRIHVEDIAQILLASIRQPNPGAIYNLCDDEAAPPQDVIAHAADLLGVDRPEAVEFENAEMSPMARSFYAESKRVSNTRIKEELGIVLKYPTYREGLKDLLNRE